MSRSRFVRSQAVIDASCLQCLLMLDVLFPAYRLLRALSLRYDKIHIPQHVWNEIVRHGHRRTQIHKLLEDYRFFKRCNVLNDHDAKLLYDRHTNPEAPIDRGEAEAIIQARECGISEVLMDEKRGRQIAEAHTLNPKGVIGLIKDFKLNDIIPEARPLFEECKRMGFRLKDRLVNEALREMGERQFPVRK
jgi:predicted nucleic acid-binding protein